jgi:uncharacterized membrane protein YczE
MRKNKPDAQTRAIPMPALTLPQRVAFVSAGVVVTGIAVGVFMLCRFGTDPFGCLCQALVRLPVLLARAPLPYWTGQVILNALPLAFCLRRKNRRLLGPGTAMNVFGVGVAADYTYRLLHDWLQFEPSPPMRLGLFAVALLGVSAGLALQMAGQLGIAPFDALPVMIKKHTRVHFRWVRMAHDVCCLALGVGLGLLTGADMPKLVGVGTVVVALGIGPMISFFILLLSKAFPQKETAL